jgi:hypothetical protein
LITDGGKFNTFVRGILQIAEVGSWVAVSCLEAMVETASATKTLSLCEIVVRLASTLRKMPNVVSNANTCGVYANDAMLSFVMISYEWCAATTLILRTCYHQVMPVVSMEDLTVRADRQLSREGVTYCNITLRPIVVTTTSISSAAASKKCAGCSGASVVYKNVPYLQGAVSLWVSQIKGDGPPSNRMSPFV